MHIELLSDRQAEDAIDGLAALLVDCVRSGASVGFLDGLGHDEARRWWAAALEDTSALTWVAREAGRVVGVVRLHPAAMPNGTHRAEVSKLQVHRDVRGQGCARALMTALEERARALGRTLLVLDTETGSPAEKVYERWGWSRVGTIEDYAASPDGRLGGTTIMTKRLQAVRRG